MDNLFKSEVIALITKAIGEIGSGNKLAKKLGVNNGTLSNMVSGKDKSISPEMWQKVAKGLGYVPKGWKLAEIKSYNSLMQTLSFAKQHSLFMAISNVAGSGKTATINQYQELENAKAVQQHIADNKAKKKDYTTKASVYVIQAGEWNLRYFLLKLLPILGEDAGKEYLQTPELEEKVIGFFTGIISKKPILIIDEADKLRPSALRFLIPLFNSFEDRLAVVIAGTDNLEKEIKNRARNSIKGYDEIDSRFARNYIRPYGVQKTDFKAICEVNGLMLDTAKLNALWAELKPITKRILEDEVRDIWKTIVSVDDIRRIKRVVLREQFKLQQTA